MSFQELLSGLGSSEALTQAAGRVGLSPDQAQDALHGVLEHMNGEGLSTRWPHQSPQRSA